MRIYEGGVRRKLIFTAKRFRAAVDLLSAADRMRNRWSEADDSARTDLWRDLHGKADAFRSTVE